MLSHAKKRARSSACSLKAGRRAARSTVLAVTAAASVIATGVMASPALAQNAASHYQFRTLDNSADPTFNQLLGINQEGLIAGYFGSGLQGHPNQGYLLYNRHGQQHYRSENWPESIQTQVTGLNDRGVTVGFWSSENNPGAMPVNDNRAFVSVRGYFIDGDYPTAMPASPPADQLLGVNDHDIAVGFYTDASGTTHAYTFNIRRDTFNEVTPSGIVNPTGAAINNRGDIAGYGTDNTGDATNGNVVGWLLKPNGDVIILAVPGATQTQALGINDSREVVGDYTASDGTMHGFTWTPQDGFRTVDDSLGSATTINGVNDRGQLVGFYTDANNNTDGFLANPR